MAASAAAAADGGGDVLCVKEDFYIVQYLLNLSEARAIRSHMINANFES